MKSRWFSSGTVTSGNNNGEGKISAVKDIKKVRVEMVCGISYVYTKNNDVGSVEEEDSDPGPKIFNK